MNILFLVHRTGRTRHFDGVIRSLAERGHRVVLAATPELTPVAVPPGLEHPLVSAVECPTSRSDEWAPLVEPLRLARDYLRYYDPRYARAVRLRRRARRRVAHDIPGFARYCDERPWVGQRWRR